MNSTETVWRFTITDVQGKQWEIIDAAADLCELNPSTPGDELAATIRTLYDKELEQEAADTKITSETALPLDLSGDPASWRFYAGDVVDYQHIAREAAATICELEKDAAPIQLAQMIRSLKRKNGLV